MPISDTTQIHWDAKWLNRFRRKLLAWYDQHARDLPWRKTRDPYRIWVSEIMLQQTQVETVKPFYQRFLKRFPTVLDLAAAQEREVLQLWEGLGYYRRARQMHAAAQVIARDYGGRFPTDLEDVHALPGIGRYTAGAITSIAFDARAPILEANTIRLFCRLLSVDEVPTRAKVQRCLWAAAEQVLPRQGCGHFNQALMELGSLVCTPRHPDCTQCPVQRECKAFEIGNQFELPVASSKKKFEELHEVAVVVKRRGRVLLRYCQTGERWAGLWDFPRVQMSSLENGSATSSGPHGESGNVREIVRLVREMTGLQIAVGPRLTRIKHGVTRFKITLDCYEAQHAATRGTLKDRKCLKWIAPRNLQDYPLSTTGREISRIVCDRPRGRAQVS